VREAPFTITEELVSSSPLIKWAHACLSGFNKIYWKPNILDNKIVPQHQVQLDKLWKQAINHGLRARRVLESTITLCGLQTPGFHNLDLSTQSWKKCLNTFQEKYVYLWFLGLATSFMKFHTACFFTRVCPDATNERPKVPFASKLFDKPGLFLTGIGFVFLRFLESRGDPQVGSTFLHLKRGLPPVHPFELQQATSDWYKLLTKPAGCILRGDEFNLPDSFNYPRDLTEFKNLGKGQKRLILMNECRRTVRELFDHHPLNKTNLGNLKVPSQSSHVEFSRFKGGAFMNIWQDYRKTRSSVDYQRIYNQDFSLERESDCHGRKKVDQLLMSLRLQKSNDPLCHAGMEYCGYSVYPKQYSSSTPLPERKSEFNYVSSDSRISFTPYQYLLWFADHSGLECRQCHVSWLADLIGHCINNCERSSEVSPVALPEPLKVRLISKGPTYRYFLGSTLQNWMWSVLREHPTFKLIGEPCTSEFLDSRLGLLGPGELFLSGDYKSATDLLDPSMSLACCDELSLLGSLGDFWSDILSVGLVGSTLVEPADLGKEIVYGDNPRFFEFNRTDDKLIQTWGQLMGSPMSFPILCLVNASINRYFYELSTTSYHRINGYTLDTSTSLDGLCCRIPKLLRYRLDQVPMLINGDDILMKMKGAYYDEWKEFVNLAGLVPSIGKNYLSNKYVIINSTLFTYSVSDLGNANFVTRPYFNTGLLHPQWNDRCGIDSDIFSLDPCCWDLGRVSYDLVKGHNPVIQDRMMSIFLGDPLVRELLRKVPAGVSYYVSKTLGGVGLFPTRENLLTCEQLGYYTRIATTRGEFAPNCPVTTVKQYHTCNIYGEVEHEVIGEDWNYETSYPGPGTNQLLEAYQFGDCAELWFENLKYCVWQKEHPRLLNGESAKRLGFEASCIAPHSTGLFRSHSCPYPERLLCNFPWRKQTLCVYDRRGDVTFESFRGLVKETGTEERPESTDSGSVISPVLEHEEDRSFSDFTSHRKPIDVVDDDSDLENMSSDPAFVRIIDKIFQDLIGA